MNSAEKMTPIERAAYDTVMQAESSEGLWRKILAEAEHGAIKATLKLMRGNQTLAALALDVSRNTLRDRIQRYDLGDVE